MPERAWRYVSLLLMVVVAVLWWRDCHRPRVAGQAARTAEKSGRASSARGAFHSGAAGRGTPGRSGPAADEPAGEGWDESGDEPPPALGPSLQQQIADHWAVRFLMPRPGETVLDYRDRVVPVAQLAMAPHRMRVAESRSRFVDAAGLSAEQEQVLDAAVQRAADDIQTHVMQSVLSGDLMPPRVRPARAVAFARDVLELVDRANREFRGALSQEQLAQLDASGFDVVDYLFFSTRWEDALGVIE